VVAPLAVASAATLVVGLASLRMSRALGEGAVSVVALATAMPAGAARLPDTPDEPVDVGLATAVQAAPARVPVTPDDAVDYDEVARRVLGEPCPASLPGCEDLWGALDPVQRDELRILVGEVMRISFRHARTQPAGTRVDWVRAPTGRGDRIVDVVIEGSSMARNYYTQIRKMMRDPTEGYAVVVERLQRKIERVQQQIERDG
jgi:hypothetical protein